MTHEDRPYELHDDFLATLTRDSYLKFRHMDTQSFSASSPSHHEPYKLKTSFSGESKHQTPSESQYDLHQVKKGPQRKAFFSQQEELSDDDEYAYEAEQFSTDPDPEEHSPYSVYQSSFHPKVPQKSFLPRQIWETLSESTKQMIIEHNKKVKLNNPTPLIQFPPEMDENWVRDGLAKLGQICKLPNWQKIVVLCVHNTTSALNS